MTNHSDSRSQTICRAFAFINYNIPPDPNEEKSNEKREFYTTVGFFDAMKTEQLQDPSLCGMWKKNEEYAMELDGKYSFQSALGIRQDTPQAEAAFWKADEEKPLVFFTFFQMQGKPLSSAPLQPYSFAILEKCVHETIQTLRCAPQAVQIDGICYLTLDKNDFIIGIKTNRYDIVAEFLLKVHDRMEREGQLILYSYSIFSVNWKLLCKDSENAVWIRNLQVQNEKIATICFKGIINTHTNGRLQEKCKEYVFYLRECLYPNESDQFRTAHSSFYNIIGDYDFQFIARDVPLVNLLRAMKPGLPEQSGLLYYGNNILRNVLYASILVLNAKSGDSMEMATTDWLRSDFQPSVAQRCHQLKVTLMDNAQKRKVIKCAKDPCAEQREPFFLGDFYEDAIESTTIGSLSKLLSSLAALERAPTRKYDFETMYWPCRSLIDLLCSEESTCVDRWEDLKSLSDFIKSLSSTLHGTLRTDIQFFQTNDFNAIVHYAPAKLRAFYSAWVYKLTKFYQYFSPDEGQKKYEFIIVPSNSSSIVTRELICEHGMHRKNADKDWWGGPDPMRISNQDYRLMYVEMPEHLLYQPEYSCVILAHEVAHFGGGEAKHRKMSCHAKYGRGYDRHTVFRRCISSWYALTCHTLLISELSDKAKSGDRNAHLLRNILVCYLDDFKDCEKYDIKQTVIYQSFFQYLPALNIDDSEKRAYAWECISIAQSALWSFVNDNLDGQFFTHATMAYKELELNVRTWMLQIDKNAKLKAKIENKMQICWTETLLAELMELLREVSQIAEKAMRSLIISSQQGTSPRIVWRIMKMIQESHADLIGILTLGLSPKQYFDSLMKSNTLGREYGANVAHRIDLRESSTQYVFIRILILVLTMKQLAEKNLENAFPLCDAQKKMCENWENLDWHTENTSTENDSVSIVCAKLRLLFKNTSISDRSFIIFWQNKLITETSSGQESLQDTLFGSYEVLNQIVSYLVGCGLEILNGPSEARNISHELCSLFYKFSPNNDYGADVYEQAIAIDQELWNFEQEQEQRYRQESD